MRKLVEESAERIMASPISYLRFFACLRTDLHGELRRRLHSWLHR